MSRETAILIVSIFTSIGFVFFIFNVVAGARHFVAWYDNEEGAGGRAFQHGLYASLIGATIIQTILRVAL